jgi:hypothetical protein
MRGIFGIAAALALLVVGDAAFGHSGGTNANGCHTNRKTGDYHCHRPKSPAPGRVTYCHIINGEARCGYAKSSCDDLVRQFGGACRAE